MTTQFISKFNSSLTDILDTIESGEDLRRNRKLYKKIYKYFKDQGVVFTGNDSIDYDRVIECIYEVI